MKNLLALLLLTQLVGCLSNSSVNRSKLSSTINGVGGENLEGLNVTRACLCKNGNVIDGDDSSCSLDCACDPTTQNCSETTALLTVKIGKDITDSFYKSNGSTYLPSSPFKSICKQLNYSCQLTLETGSTPDKIVVQTPRTISESSSSAKIISDTISESKIQITGLTKAINRLGVNILYKSTITYEGNTKKELNIFVGDGSLDPANIRALNRYTCSHVNAVVSPLDQSKLEYSLYSLETFHYSPPVTPQFFYINPIQGILQRWPFLCHNNISNLPISWLLDSSGLPTLGNFAEIIGQAPLPRMNNADTTLRFWGDSGSDSADFSKYVDPNHPELQYAIERRVLVDFTKTPNNGEWIAAPLFRKLSVVSRPKETIITAQNGQKIISYEKSSIGYYLEPQPADGLDASERKDFACPKKDDLIDASSGRLASIKKVLSQNGKLKYATEPFYIACADGLTYLAGANGFTASTYRRIIYVSQRDLIALGYTENELSSDDISNRRFDLQALQDVRANGFLVNRNTDAKKMYLDPLSFRIVRPAVETLDSCNDTSNTESGGFIYGCYPVPAN